MISMWYKLVIPFIPPEHTAKLNLRLDNGGTFPQFLAFTSPKKKTKQTSYKQAIKQTKSPVSLEQQLRHSETGNIYRYNCILKPKHLSFSIFILQYYKHQEVWSHEQEQYWNDAYSTLNLTMLTFKFKWLSTLPRRIR